MENTKLLSALYMLEDLLAKQKELSEGGFFEAHKVAEAARKNLADLIKQIGAIES